MLKKCENAAALVGATVLAFVVASGFAAVAQAKGPTQKPQDCKPWVKSNLKWNPLSPAHCEQWRYIAETAEYRYEDFLKRKADFVIAGCEHRPGDPLRGACSKPPPYDAFDWTTDGCSPPTPAAWKAIFDGPCQQHDFGYRNYGKGLNLGRSESTRGWIDRRFKKEMQRVCGTLPLGPQRVTCGQVAKAMYNAVKGAQLLRGRAWGWGT